MVIQVASSDDLIQRYLIPEGPILVHFSETQGTREVEMEEGGLKE